MGLQDVEPTETGTFVVRRPSTIKSIRLLVVRKREGICIPPIFLERWLDAELLSSAWAALGMIQ